MALVSPAAALPARGFGWRPLRGLSNRYQAECPGGGLRPPWSTDRGGWPKLFATPYCENHKEMLYISTCRRTERPARGPEGRRKRSDNAAPEAFGAEPRTRENFLFESGVTH